MAAPVPPKHGVRRMSHYLYSHDFGTIDCLQLRSLAACCETEHVAIEPAYILRFTLMFDRFQLSYRSYECFIPHVVMLVVSVLNHSISLPHSIS